jgi:hypothetical protein
MKESLQARGLLLYTHSTAMKGMQGATRLTFGPAEGESLH